MARTVVPLTDTKIKNSKAKEKDFTLPDGNGLHLLIKINNTKLWEFIYTSPTTLKRRKTSFGNYPQTTLKIARDKRQDYHKLISQGIDPIDYLKTIKDEIKSKQIKQTDYIEKISNNYLVIKKKNKNLKEITIEKATNRLKSHFYPHLTKNEKTVIHEISFENIIKLLKILEKKNLLETLFRVKILIIEIFKFAYSQGIIKETDIFAKLELYNFRTQHRSEIKNNPTFTKKEDIKELYKKIVSYHNNLITKYLLIFSIHTAQRQGSIIKIKWEDIDLNEKIWEIPISDMKMRKKHIVPISDVLLNYLKELFILTGDSTYIFPNSQIKSTRNKYPHISNNTVTSALRKMGISNNEQTAHGFRAMFKTVCKEHQEEYNISNEFVERILAHKVESDVESAYNRALNIKEMRIITNWWSNYLEELLI